MVKISHVTPFILHVPVTGGSIADSTHSITHWGVVGARITAEDGTEGFGFTGTHADLATDRLIAGCIRDSYAPLVTGASPMDWRRLWMVMARRPAVQWVGRAGITQLALAAMDTALWDLRCKLLGQPLWQALGGCTSERIEAYNTDGGWLSLPLDEVVANCRRLVEEEGYRGVKIKVGLPDPREDLRRIYAVRRAIGPEVKLAVDGNGRWDLPTALQHAPALAEAGLLWFEEPLWYEDIAGHAALARASTTPVALGEQLYTADAFEAFLDAGAVHYVQPDVTRLGGITEWLTVAESCLIRRLPVAAHVGDMGQVHVHLAYHHPACNLLEYIPWIRHCFAEPVTVKDGFYARPAEPGAGTTLLPDALEKYGMPVP
jgi:L-alanine-DL-glutamate epimerase-like enolase superfamily enzyme